MCARIERLEIGGSGVGERTESGGSRMSTLFHSCIVGDPSYRSSGFAYPPVFAKERKNDLLPVATRLGLAVTMLRLGFLVDAFTDTGACAGWVERSEIPMGRKEEDESGDKYGCGGLVY